MSDLRVVNKTALEPDWAGHKTATKDTAFVLGLVASFITKQRVKAMTDINFENKINFTHKFLAHHFAIVHLSPCIRKCMNRMLRQLPNIESGHSALGK